MRNRNFVEGHVVRWSFLLLALCIVAGSVGCNRSVRPQATALATAGKTTAEQMATYYDTLAKDTINVWEMTAFDRGFTGLPQTDTTVALQKAYKDRYLALLARKRFAGTLAETYDQFSHLSSYDSSADVLASVDRLNEAAKGLQGRPLIPPTPVNSPVNSTDAITALVTETQTAAENRSILSENKRLVPLLEKIKLVFDAELPVYKSIADDKRRVYTTVAQSLVKGKAVDSTALVNRVLQSYELKWPTPTQPFTDQNLINAIVEVIDARANPISQMSQDTGEQISDSLTQLVSLHKSLVAGKPLTFEELARQNAVIEDLLDALKTKTNVDITSVF